MALYTKCIFSPIQETDGLRICVMSRLTENDGKTPILNLVQGKYFDIWIKLLAMPDHLVQKWYAKKLDWRAINAEYLKHLLGEQQTMFVKSFANLALTQNVTFLCVEKTPERCHRQILALECLKHEENLVLSIK